MTKAPATLKAWRMSMDVGQRSFQHGRMGDAINAFNQATKLQPIRVEGWVNLGSALLEGKRFEAAVVALDKAIELRPNLGAAHMLLGDAFRQLGDFQVAVHSYRTAVALKRSPLSLNRLACALRVHGDWEDARQLYLEALQLDANFSLAQVNLATLSIEAGQFDDARSQLQRLSTRSLPTAERTEVLSAQRALAEYFRLHDALAALRDRDEATPLRSALTQCPDEALIVDSAALDSARRYITSAARLTAGGMSLVAELPPEWPLIEALFMIPLVETVQEYREFTASQDAGQQVDGELLESLNMQSAIAAARSSRDKLHDPIEAEVQLRHWHALACRGVAGFLPGHFKYTQNWTTRNPALKRVDAGMASGTFRHFVRHIYTTLPPGLPRAAVVCMSVCDLHAFADGNGRVAMTWMNRELEWAGLMPALFPRKLGFKGELGEAMKTVRLNGGDLTPLIAVIEQAQTFATEFLTALRT